MRERRGLVLNGTAVVTLVVDRNGDLQSDPQISTQGVFDRDTDQDIADGMIDAVIDALEDMPAKSRRTDDSVREAVRIGLRRWLRAICGKRPKTEIHLVRV